jgi:glycine/D-amino acid oxidase-like deaminating enzyme
MKTVDFLIVGQGLAGTLIAYELLQQKKAIYIIDNQHFEAASKVAAGLINPITGRRIVKSEQIDELLPTAKATYQALEKYLDISIWHERNILWALSNIKEENDWYSRAIQPGISDYIIENPDNQTFLTKVKAIKSFGEVQHSAQVDISLLISAFAKKLLSQNQLSQNIFDYNKLIINEKGIIYEGIAAKNIIFCEGQLGRFNPFFQETPFAVAKGEALIIKADDLPKEKIIKGNITICPLPDNTFWVGSNYEWNPKNSKPTVALHNEFVRLLDELLNVSYEIIEHKAAIRPSTKNRKIIFEKHNTHHNLFIFNGLGTKGTSLAPYWTKHCVAQILQEIEVGKPN